MRGNGTEKLVGNKVDYGGYALGLIPFAAPWIFMLIVSLLGWFCYCLCCICDKCCPPSKCCRRDLDKKPFKKRELTIPNICILVWSVCIFAFAIASFSFNNNLDSGLKSFRCSLIYFVDDFIFGANFTINNTNKSWIGIIPITPRLLDLGN